MRDPEALLGPASGTLFRQRYENHRAMVVLSEGLSDADRQLVRRVADITMAFHARHLRGGDSHTHYSGHLLEVAERVNLHFRNPGEKYFSPEEKEVSARALALCGAYLHDSEEDIQETIGTVYSRRERFDAVEARIRENLKPYLNQDGINRLTSLVRTLSIKNDAGIPDSEYVQGIDFDPIAFQIKAADIDHNMLTMPQYAPTYGAVVVPSQFAELMAGSPYDDSFRRQVCACVLNIYRSADYRRDPQSPGESMVKKLVGIEGGVIGPRLVKFYDSLIDEINKFPKSSIVPPGKSARQIIAALEDFRDALTAIGNNSRPTRDFPIRELNTEIGTIKVLGPIKSWCATITSNCTEKDLEEAIFAASKDLKTRISGFISRDGDSVTYQMSRWPRRAGEDVPAIIEYAKAIRCIQANLEEMGLGGTVKYNPQQGQCRFQSLLGLEEGYFEGRKHGLLMQIAAGNLDSRDAVIKAFREEIGEPSQFGLRLSRDMTLDEISSELRSRSLSKLHSIDEVVALIRDNPDIRLTPARIFSVNYPSGIPYQEPAVLLDGGADSDLPRIVSEIAREFHQARISVQWGREIPEAYNLEFNDDAQNAAARLR